MTPARPPARRRALVVGMGNVLRGDDGFGPAVVQLLEMEGGLPAGTRLREFGIGGIALVQELMDETDLLIIVDAVDRASPPGTVHVLEPEVPDAEGYTVEERLALAADAHELVPSRALVLSRALGVLPRTVRIVGCQPAVTDELTMDLSPAVSGAVPEAARTVRDLLRGAPSRRNGAEAREEEG